jgi:hypothetical protein
MYERSHTKFIEVKGSHSVYISQPEAVAKVIKEAASAVKELESSTVEEAAMS